MLSWTTIAAWATLTNCCTTSSWFTSVIWWCRQIRRCLSRTMTAMINSSRLEGRNFSSRLWMSAIYSRVWSSDNSSGFRLSRTATYHQQVPLSLIAESEIRLRLTAQLSMLRTQTAVSIRRQTILICYKDRLNMTFSATTTKSCYPSLLEIIQTETAEAAFKLRQAEDRNAFKTS